MLDVVALGELLIDFIQNGESQQGNKLFEANPGGAPCNVLALLQKFGYKTAFIGKVGKDTFGDMLASTVKELGISIDGLCFDKEIPTTLALVHTFSDGDRDFSFYRKPGADVMLTEEELNLNLIRDCKIFHFGTLSLTEEPVASATKKAVAYAKEHRKIISFDPNYRAPLWKSEDDAKEAIWYGIENCDILKIADNEIQWLTGKEDFDEGFDILRRRTSAQMVNITLGKEGSICRYGSYKVFVPAFVNETTIDTTGAGDTFCGSVLSYILEHSLDYLTEENLKEMLTFANAAASVVTTKKGALLSMPGKDEVMEKVQSLD